MKRGVLLCCGDCCAYCYFLRTWQSCTLTRCMRAPSNNPHSPLGENSGQTCNAVLSITLLPLQSSITFYCRGSDMAVYAIWHPRPVLARSSCGLVACSTSKDMRQDAHSSWYAAWCFSAASDCSLMFTVCQNLFRVSADYDT